MHRAAEQRLLGEARLNHAAVQVRMRDEARLGEDAAVRVSAAELPDAAVARLRVAGLTCAHALHPVEEYFGVSVQVPADVVEAWLHFGHHTGALVYTTEQVRAVDTDTRQAPVRVVRSAHPLAHFSQHRLAAHVTDSGVGMYGVPRNRAMLENLAEQLLCSLSQPAETVNVSPLAGAAGNGAIVLTSPVV